MDTKTENIRRRKVLKQALQQLKENKVKGHNGDERQYNITVDNIDYWIWLIMENRNWKAKEISKWGKNILQQEALQNQAYN